MNFKETKIKGLYIITPELKKDVRGTFFRTFCQKELADHGLKFNIVQINYSLTRQKETIRGLHYQKKPFEEDKIVLCLKGAIYDVVVDIRQESASYGLWESANLNAENKKMLYIPKGMAHGFQALTNNCEVLYLMSEFYHSDYATGIRFDDPLLKINWPLRNQVLSEKDRKWSYL